MQRASARRLLKAQLEAIFRQTTAVVPKGTSREDNAKIVQDPLWEACVPLFIEGNFATYSILNDHHMMVFLWWSFCDGLFVVSLMEWISSTILFQPSYLLAFLSYYTHRDSLFDINLPKILQKFAISNTFSRKKRMISRKAHLNEKTSKCRKPSF